MMIWLSVTRVGTGTTSSACVSLEQHGDSKFSREFYMGMSNFLFGGGYQNTEGVPKFLGDLTWGVPNSWGCQIPYDTGSYSPVLKYLLSSGQAGLSTSIVFTISFYFNCDYHKKKLSLSNSCTKETVLQMCMCTRIYCIFY